MWEKQFTRRNFLKATAVAGGAAVAADVMSFRTWLSAAENAPVIIKPSLCGSCSSECGMLVHLKNGRIWKVAGHPDHAKSRGKLCGRGNASIHWPYIPDRLTKPLKRMEDGSFKPISWEQAFSEIGTKFKELAAKDPSTLFFAHNPRPVNNFYGPRLMAALGSPTVITHGSSCRLGRDVGFGHTMGGNPSADLGSAKFAMFLGRNYGEGIVPASVTTFAQAKEKGTKLVMVDPRYNNSVPLMGEYVAIRPGTDLAFLLAIMHVMIKENLYDADFVEKNTVGFEELKSAVAETTPEWAAKISGIPAAAIIRLTREMAAAKPRSFIDPSWRGAFGCNYVNSTQTARAAACVNALLGNVNRTGGLVFGVNVKPGALDPVKYPNPPKPQGVRFDGAGVKGKFPLAPAKDGLSQLIATAAAEGKCKGGIVYRHNIVRVQTDPQKLEEGFKKMECLVVIDIQMSETAQCAHYVLPEDSFLERDELPDFIASKTPYAAVRSKVVEPVHADTKPQHEIIAGIAKAAGVGKYFEFTLEDINNALFAPLGLTWEQVKQKGIIVFKDTAWKEGWKDVATPSKKVELYSQRFVDAGFPGVPVWEPPRTKPEKGEFYLLQGKQGIMSHCGLANNPYILEIAKKYGLERLWINASKARELGIQDGDTVVVESAIAKRTVKAKTTERIHPEAVALLGGYGNFSKGLKQAYGFGINANDFAPLDAEPISGHNMMAEVAVKVRKEG